LRQVVYEKPAAEVDGNPYRRVFEIRQRQHRAVFPLVPGRPHSVPLILTTLCIDGFIPAGRYIIDTRREQSPIEQYRALLRKTGTPESKECIAFRQSHRSDKAFIRLAAEIDNQVLAVLRQQK
jgi:hypothetical protein